MSKKKKQKASKKSVIEFEMKNSGAVEEATPLMQEENLASVSADNISAIKSELAEKESLPNWADSSKEPKSAEDLSEILSDSDRENDLIQGDESSERNKKTDLYIEWALIFVLGILIGIAVKTESLKRVAIGFDDYKMKVMRQDYNINKIQFELTKKSMEEAESLEEQSFENQEQDESVE